MAHSFFKAVFVCAGKRLYRVDDGLTVSPVADSEHKQDILSMTCTYEELWCLTPSLITIWNTHSLNTIRSLSVPRSLSVLAPVTLAGRPLIWAGADDSVLLYDLFARRWVRTLELPRKGTVTAILAVGVDTVWVASENDQGRGALYSWEFSHFSV